MGFRAMQTRQVGRPVCIAPTLQAMTTSSQIYHMANIMNLYTLNQTWQDDTNQQVVQTHLYL